ncbi:hypothetical protein GGG87_05570 [Streptococcus sp. zg-86]|uniref:DUF4352 domain-containing protein n=1 Tax=Streptococcus zhangguiae TaxID=2664091 RepID=A0A6I4RGE4_9STRE|nr:MULTISPECIES: hypothetical protein [unclassified Streptococcus]MTB64457.1 hypothetical protein [Streptococcus sp. zg-86]MTB90853.1 hypothetical protein [Streptococcus sp. zg-36]MWV56444.1 hypothetical protein [Streptococcus sp. zg-70]QTH47349.1 hypothetical protein J5M87_07235 [Streptococcus sp. zg-86]
MKRSKLLLVGLSVGLLFNLVACSSAKDSQKEMQSEQNTAQETSTSSPTQQKYSIGDKITFEGKVEYTVTGAEWSEERNQFDNSNPEKVLKMTYNVTNLSDKDLLIGSDIDLYVNGKKMESYPNAHTIETISAGRSYEGAIENFGVNGSGEMEFEIKPFADFSGTKPAIVAFNLD